MEKYMKSKIKFWIIVKMFFVAFIVSGFVSCGVIPQVAEVTIRNNSGEEVKDITVFYTHGNDGDKTEHITKLSNGASKKLKLQITKSQAGFGGGTYVGWIWIEYYIKWYKIW